MRPEIESAYRSEGKRLGVDITLEEILSARKFMKQYMGCGMDEASAFGQSLMTIHRLQGPIQEYDKRVKTP